MHEGKRIPSPRRWPADTGPSPGRGAAGGRGASGEGDSAGGGVPLFAFVKTITALPSLLGDAGRAELTDLLPAPISTRVPYDPRPLIHVYGLVIACMDHEDGLPALLDALWILEGDSLPMREVLEAMVTLTGREWAGGPNGLANGQANGRADTEVHIEVSDDG